MEEQKYHVCFRGEILPGFDPEQSKNEFLKLFKIPREKAPVIFSGKQVVLKKGVNKQTALKFQKAFQRVGVKPVFKKIQISSQKEQATPHTSLKQNQQFSCPKCGTPQEKGDECLSCGVIFAKYEEIKLREKQDLGEEALSGLNSGEDQKENLANEVLTQARHLQASGKTDEAVEMVKAAMEAGNDHWKLRFFLTEQKLDSEKDADQHEDLHEKRFQQQEYVQEEERQVELESQKVALSGKIEKKEDTEEKEEEENFNLGPDDKYHIYDAEGAMVMESSDIKEIRSSLLNGTIHPEYTFNVNGKPPEKTIKEKMTTLYFSISMVVAPIRSIGTVFAALFGLIAGLYVVFAHSFLWTLEFFVNTFGWYFQTLEGNFILVVLFFIPFFKGLLIGCLIVLLAPALLGAVLAGIVGMMVGAIVGVFLWPFLPKIKKQKLAVAQQQL